MNPGHRLSSKRFVTEVDFTGEILVSFAEESKDGFLQYCLLPVGVELKSFFTIDQPEGIVEMIRSGIGVALLPRWSVSKYIDQDDLVGIPFSKQGFRLQWNVSLLKDARLPVFQQHFIDMFSEFTPVPAKKKKAP